MAEAFKPGDTVKMKSGGPLMTVDSFSDDGDVWCEWFDDKNEPQGRSFKPHMLVHDDGTPGIA